MAGRTYDLSRKGDRVLFNEAAIDLTLRTQIRAMRSARGWSQKELARRAGLAVRTIIRLEHPHGALSCRLETLEQIARAFDVGLTARFALWSTALADLPADPTPPDYGHDGALHR